MHPRTISAKLLSAAISILWLGGASLQGESRLQVVSPDNGSLVNAGGALSVTIKAPPSQFQSVSIVGDGLFALSTGLTAPPYQYSYLIPGDFPSGVYRFKAAGVTAAGETVYSDTVEIDVEQAGDAKKILSEYQSLAFGDEKTLPLLIWAVGADGSKIDVTRSKRMTYTSDKPAVATVSNEGSVTPMGVGKAKITVKYGDKLTLVVTVTVTRDPSRDSALRAKDLGL